MIDAIRRLDVRTRDEVQKAAERERARFSVDGEVEPHSQTFCVRRLVSLDAMVADLEPLLSPLSEVAPFADEVAENNAQQTLLLGAIADLPPRQREAIELGLFEGLALREIGDRMGISESRVCQLQKRAIQHLQRAVTPKQLDAA
jgi:RNA polymerase sigma factor for flagellar operon FliA